MKSDKKKSELYFGNAVKKILTENVSRQAPLTQKKQRVSSVDAAGGVAHDFSTERTKTLIRVAPHMNFPAPATIAARH